MNNENSLRKAESVMNTPHENSETGKHNNSDPGKSKDKSNNNKRMEVSPPPRNRTNRARANRELSNCPKKADSKANGLKDMKQEIEKKSGPGKNGGKKPKKKKKKKKKKGEKEVQYIKKSVIQKIKESREEQQKSRKIKKLEQQIRNMVFEEDKSAGNGSGKPRSRSLSSGRSSNRSSRSDEGIYGKAKSLIPKSRQKMIDEREDYLLNKKKFYNLKFEKKLEMIKNSPKNIAREFYKIDYTHKFLSAISRNFRNKPEELKRYNIPLRLTAKGEAELTNSYYVLLNSIDFFSLCRHCKINSFDATKDTRKVASHKISLMIKKMKVNEQSLGASGYEENLKFNLSGVSSNLLIGDNRRFFNPLHVFRRR